MSEESITVVQKEKNPKRVEGGKRLAAYNKAPREKMLATREGQTAADEQNSEGSYILPFITGIVVISGLTYLYFVHKPDKKKAVVKEEDNTDQEQNPPKPVGKSKLRSLD